MHAGTARGSGSGAELPAFCAPTKGACPVMRRVLAGFLLAAALLSAQWGGELRFCLRSHPKTFNPLLVEDDASETIRYLTGGVLLRVNRLTQELEPELATSWKISRPGRTI